MEMVKQPIFTWDDLESTPTDSQPVEFVDDVAYQVIILHHVLFMARQLTPNQTYPPPEIRPYSTLISEGWTLRGAG